MNDDYSDDMPWSRLRIVGAVYFFVMIALAAIDPVIWENSFYPAHRALLSMPVDVDTTLTPEQIEHEALYFELDPNNLTTQEYEAIRSGSPNVELTYVCMQSGLFMASLWTGDCGWLIYMEEADQYDIPTDELTDEVIAYLPTPNVDRGLWNRFGLLLFLGWIFFVRVFVQDET